MWTSPLPLPPRSPFPLLWNLFLKKQINLQSNFSKIPIKIDEKLKIISNMQTWTFFREDFSLLSLANLHSSAKLKASSSHRDINLYKLKNNSTKKKTTQRTKPFKISDSERVPAENNLFCSALYSNLMHKLHVRDSNCIILGD